MRNEHGTGGKCLPLVYHCRIGQTRNTPVITALASGHSCSMPAEIRSFQRPVGITDKLAGTDMARRWTGFVYEGSGLEYHLRACSYSSSGQSYGDIHPPVVRFSRRGRARSQQPRLCCCSWSRRFLHRAGRPRHTAAWKRTLSAMGVAPATSSLKHGIGLDTAPASSSPR